LDVLAPKLINPFLLHQTGWPTFVPYTLNAGPDQAVSGTTAQLSASGTASTGYTIASWLWKLVSGSPCIITTPNAQSTSVTGLTTGTAVFSVQMADNNTATISDTVKVTVTIPVNRPPVAVIAPIAAITLPADTISLDGSGSYDPDGTVAAYSWTILSGPCGYNLTSPTASKSFLLVQQAGVYVVQLTVTDNKGATNSAEATVAVNAARTISKIVIYYSDGTTMTQQ
jgi:hypothetical protein